jgi:hypothetical protein
MSLLSLGYSYYKPGLEKTQVVLKKTAGRLKTGIFTGFSGKSGFLNRLFIEKISMFAGQNQSSATVKYATTINAAWNFKLLELNDKKI